MERTIVLVHPIAATPQEQVRMFAECRRALTLPPGMELRCVTAPEHLAGYHPGPDVIVLPEEATLAGDMADTIAATGCDIIDVATFKERYPA